MKPLVLPRPFGGSALVRDYLGGVESAASFYAGSPFQIPPFASKLEEVSRRFTRTERERAARALQPGSPRAAERLARFVAEGGAMVTTGQQAGFLTGPLYTVYKALSAVALARELEQRLGTLVLPVFWAATEDHDWSEVNNTVLLDARGRLRRVGLADLDPRPLPMSDLRLSEEVRVVLDEVCHLVGASGDMCTRIRPVIESYQPGATVGGAFVEAMRRLLGSFDLCFVDAADPAVKAASGGVLRRALLESREHEAVLTERSAAIESAGYRPQVSILPQATNVFLHGDGGRQRISRRGEGFVTRGRRDVVSREEVLSELATAAERFSPNVMLRPIVESEIFPTLAYVGGPGEVAYFAQATALFEAFGIQPPLAVPRFSGMVVEGAVERLMAKLELTEADLTAPREAVLDRVMRRAIPKDVSAALDGIRGSLVEGYSQLIDRSVPLDPTLAGPLGGLRNRALADAARAERKILRALKRRDTTTRSQVERVLDSLRPEGLPQDRILNVVPFLARYGPHFLHSAEEAIREHWAARLA